MDSVKQDDRGQALVVAVLLLGISAAAVVGLTHAQSRLLAAAHELRAGEAAVAAAGTFVAGRAFELHRSLGRLPDPDEVAEFVAAPELAEGAGAAATEMARLHGTADPSGVEIRSFGTEIEVDLVLAGRRHRALLDLFDWLRDKQ